MPPSRPEDTADGSGGPRRGRRRCRFRFAALLVALAAVTGCTGVPDRGARSEAVSAALRALPGIDRVDGQYANGITVGQSYNVTVFLRSDAGDPELTALAHTYDQQVAAADLAGHTLRLTLQSADGDRLTLYSRDGRLESTAPTTRRWGRLIVAVPGAVSWSGIEGGLIEVRSDDVAETVDLLRAQAADLESVHWILREGGTRIDLMGAYPAAPLAAVLHELATSQEQWTIAYQPTDDVALTTGVWQFDGDDVAATARRHLRVLASTGLRVDHAERLPGQSAIEVSIGGCRTDGSTLQQELNVEFGSC